jgi:hypothetical protein
MLQLTASALARKLRSSSMVRALGCRLASRHQRGRRADAVGHHQRRRSAAGELLDDVAASLSAQSGEIGDFGCAEHLDAMRMDQVQVADLIDRVGRGQDGGAVGAVLAGDPGQAQRRAGAGCQLTDRQPGRPGDQRRVTDLGGVRFLGRGRCPGLRLAHASTLPPARGAPAGQAAGR